MDVKNSFGAYALAVGCATLSGGVVVTAPSMVVQSVIQVRPSQVTGGTASSTPNGINTADELLEFYPSDVGLLTDDDFAMLLAAGDAEPADYDAAEYAFDDE